MADTLTLNKKGFLIPTVPDKFVDLSDAQRTVSQLQRCLSDIVQSLQVTTLKDGDVIGPATNHDLYIPQWDGVNLKTLKDGIDPATLVNFANNIKPVVNASVNKLDIFTKSGGAAPDATNFFTISIPDGNGYTARTRKAAYLSGTSQIIMADAANYWSKGSLDAEIKTAYVYAIWDAAGGIVWALGGYSGFTRVPASTTATDDDFFLLEDGSTYTKVITDYCVCVGKIRYQYDTGDNPDHTIQATALDAPQVLWNPKSDYGYSKILAADNVSGGAIADYSAINLVVKQSGKYFVSGHSRMAIGAGGAAAIKLSVGSSTYGSSTQLCQNYIASLTYPALAISKIKHLNAGDTIHLGLLTTAASTIYGDGTVVGATSLNFFRID